VPRRRDKVDRPASSLGQHGRRRIEAVIAAVHRRSPRRVLGLGLVLLLLVGLTDEVAGADYSFSIFYLLVVLAVAATGRDRYALLVALAAAAVWALADAVNRGAPNPVLSVLWNASARFAVLYICALLVAAVVATATDEREQSRRCAMTGLLNRRGFWELAEREVALAARIGAPLAVAYLDVDGFKEVNDTGGHAAGDRLLQDVAGALCVLLRRTDGVGRLGGDEFVVLLPATDAAGAQVAGERLRTSLDEMSRREGWPVHYSIGVAAFSRAPGSVDEVLAEADRLMYQAKQQGRGTGSSTIVLAAAGSPGPTAAGAAS
jgi:diguanylate cyclase (GGDEF)-like protein